ncbi:hypothetical protein WS73_16535 [Burkholderia savannae]|nr:hypothetical protein WS73_16535 [Burkholderia savannae]
MPFTHGDSGGDATIADAVRTTTTRERSDDRRPTQRRAHATATPARRAAAHRHFSTKARSIT